ncbi:hypothetical protein Mhun_0390 [Methanospirillum hungatei JF-1]|uniref:Glycosyl transferase, group 1 n=1 Tax=Methanospirillum hungatei JF-1 (strain ATCC 27890 / DSM 864 / NBRC 100397 / JF-1) TaxID=323259 RepID=Q2FQD3_METHJ|nr:glycosyltransferase family 4 protein [Methanospirillum hungatei]ABD40155.1 hypothetical protein Mhun_0390 [Methanospirillum hungatei JF-1]
MNIIILDIHPLEDGRIQRHIKYLLEKKIKVYRIHYNYTDKTIKTGPFSLFGEVGYIRNIFLFGNKKINTFLFLILCQTFLFYKDCIKILKKISINENEKIIIHIHDPQLLPLGEYLKTRYSRNIQLVYDRHEIYEVLNNYLELIFGFPNFFEKRINKKEISGVVIISDLYYQSTKNIFPYSNILSISNFPSIKNYDLDKIKDKYEKFNEDSIINMVYIGGLSKKIDRDIDLLLEVFFKILETCNNVKVILGGKDLDPSLLPMINDLSQKYPKRFEYLGYVPYSITNEITQKAHIGFNFIKPESEYWVKISSNKINEYLICGTIPIVRADVENYMEIQNVAIIFGRNESKELILNTLLKLVSNPELMKSYMKEGHKIGMKNTWESIADRYLLLYEYVSK